MEAIVKTVRDVVVEKYGSINTFLDVKTKEFSGELPISRPYLYKLINLLIPGCCLSFEKA